MSTISKGMKSFEERLTALRYIGIFAELSQLIVMTNSEKKMSRAFHSRSAPGNDRWKTDTNVILVFLLSRVAFPASSRISAVRSESEAVSR